MENRYKNCVIITSSFQRVKDGPWIPEAHLMCNNTASTGKSFYVRPDDHQGFETQTEADIFAIQFAKQWIDQAAI